MPVTRLPAAAATSYVKQRPETWAKRPSAPGMRETPFSRNAFTSAPVSVTVVVTFPNGRTPSTEPRVIDSAGVDAEQKPDGPASGQVRAARRPPEFVIAKSVPYFVRIASVTTFPTS